jgi:hypothetical protein
MAGFSRSAAVKAWSRRMHITPFRSSSRLRETVGIRGKRGDWRMGNGVVVRPDVVHSYNGNGAVGAMLFVDPESLEGVWLRSSLREEITLVPSSGLLSCAGELRRFLGQPLESLEIAALIKHCVHASWTGAPPSRRPCSTPGR